MDFKANRSIERSLFRIEIRRKIKLAALILLQCSFVSLLVAQTPAPPANTTVKTSSQGTQQTMKSHYADANLTYKIIDITGGTYGYDVYDGTKLIIHQNSMPAIPGNQGFSSKADASKVAEKVIAKIKKGEMPPTITVEDLKEMNVIK